MSLRSRFIGAMRRGQNLSAVSPMDTLLKRPAREPLPPARRELKKSPSSFRSIGVMQRSQIV
ncbi:MAG: hypothetical protein R6T98_10745 [Desulfatiglandales bacterium]